MPQPGRACVGRARACVQRTRRFLTPLTPVLSAHPTRSVLGGVAPFARAARPPCARGRRVSPPQAVATAIQRTCPVPPPLPPETIPACPARAPGRRPPARQPAPFQPGARGGRTPRRSRRARLLCAAAVCTLCRSAGAALHRAALFDLPPHTPHLKVGTQVYCPLPRRRPRRRATACHSPTVPFAPTVPWRAPRPCALWHAPCGGRPAV